MPQAYRNHRILAEAELLEYRKVTNSGGQVQIRPVIVTPVQLGEHQWQVELTLTNRDVMGFRMLLGRQAVRDPKATRSVIALPSIQAAHFCNQSNFNWGSRSLIKQ